MANTDKRRTIRGRTVSGVKSVALKDAGESPSFAESYWRRRRDLNPRYPFGHSGFQDRRLKPLGHSSEEGEFSLSWSAWQRDPEKNRCGLGPRFTRSDAASRGESSASRGVMTRRGPGKKRCGPEGPKDPFPEGPRRFGVVRIALPTGSPQREVGEPSCPSWPDEGRGRSVRRAPPFAAGSRRARSIRSGAGAGRRLARSRGPFDFCAASGIPIPCPRRLRRESLGRRCNHTRRHCRVRGRPAHHMVARAV